MTGLRLDTSCAAAGLLADGNEVNAPSHYGVAYRPRTDVHGFAIACTPNNQLFLLTKIKVCYGLCSKPSPISATPATGTHFSLSPAVEKSRTLIECL